MRGRHLFIGIVAATSTQVGCYKYIPTEPAAIQPTQEIRVTVTEPAALRIAREYGINNPIEGEFEVLGPDSLGLAVWVGKAFSGSDFANARQTVPLFRQEILVVQRKEFSRKKTLYFTVAVAGALVFLSEKLGFTEVFWKEDGETQTPPVPEPEEFRLRIRR